MTLGMAILAGGRKGVVRWVERGFSIRLVAGDALGLNDFLGLVDGSSWATASDADSKPRADPEHDEMPRPSIATHPHG